MSEDASHDRSLVSGMTLSPSGHVHIKRGVGPVLFDLAVKLGDSLAYPVDVQHVVAAIVLAAEEGVLPHDQSLSADDPRLLTILAKHVETIFKRYHGRVCEDE